MLGCSLFIFFIRASSILSNCSGAVAGLHIWFLVDPEWFFLILSCVCKLVGMVNIANINGIRLQGNFWVLFSHKP